MRADKNIIGRINMTGKLAPFHFIGFIKRIRLREEAKTIGEMQFHIQANRTVCSVHPNFFMYLH